jgi:hypothetical protein
MAKKSMEQFAKGWKSPEQKAEEKREAVSASPKCSGKDSKDSKGPTAGAWKKSGFNPPKSKH